MTSTWKVDCKTCSKKLAFGSVIRHMKTVHEEKIGKIWSCKECGKICQTEKRLVIHENVHKENHISNQQFHCEECPYRTIVKEYLVNHVRLMHKTDKSRMFLCTLGSWQVRQQAKILSQPWETWKTQNYTCGCILWWLWQEIFGKKKFKKTH